MDNKENMIEEENVELSYIGGNARLTPEEREIVLIMDDKDRKWKASCSSPTYMKKFEAQGWKCIGEEYYRDGTVCTKFYEAPQQSITIGSYERPKRAPLSEEQKAKMQAGKKLASNQLN